LVHLILDVRNAILAISIIDASLVIVIVTMMASVNVVVGLNAIEHVVLGANVDVQPKEEYDKV
jgi:hypothetical protein